MLMLGTSGFSEINCDFQINSREASLLLRFVPNLLMPPYLKEVDSIVIFKTLLNDTMFL